jgi:hypothetical protein
MNARRLQRVVLAACVALCWSIRGTAADMPVGLDWHEPWMQPHDARAAASNSDEYAWRVFVAVNWPADRVARTADPTARLGSDRPSVWESWQNTADVFRDDGADPGPWSPGATVAIADRRRFETFSLKDLPNARHIVNGRMVPVHDPILNDRRLTEIRLNRAEYDYIRARELYNLDGQLKVLLQHGSLHFPSAATAVKARWRPIRAEEQSRYHSLRVLLPDGSTRLYGLTALHLVTKDLPNWFWATFEQVDNPSLPDADGWQLPSSDHFACRGASPNCNRTPAGIGLEGTVWQYYRLRGTLNRFIDASGRPLRLANSELESGMQQTASCMTCHARASIGLAGGSPVRLPVFNTAIRVPTEDPPARRGYLGLPQAAWFDGPDVHGVSRRMFEPLDFVWSLSQAQPKRVTQ